MIIEIALGLVLGYLLLLGLLLLISVSYFVLPWVVVAGLLILGVYLTISYPQYAASVAGGVGLLLGIYFGYVALINHLARSTHPSAIRFTSARKTFFDFMICRSPYNTLKWRAASMLVKLSPLFLYMIFIVWLLSDVKR